MILNLDREFRPWTGEEVSYESFVFAGGEPHIKIHGDLAGRMVSVAHRINSFNDLGLLCISVDALSRMDAVLDTLFIPYFPAARQDRVMTKGEPLSVKVYANIINALGFKKVLILDAHSEVTPALVNHSEVMPNYGFITAVLNQIGRPVVLVSPDGGALKKIYKLSEYLGGVPVIECGKIRDVSTGKLSGFKVYSDDLDGADCLVVDDICDGGGTFTGLAGALRSKGAGQLFLAVSHGIFSKGVEALTSFYSHVYTTNSIKDLAMQEGVTQVAINLK